MTRFIYLIEAQNGLVKIGCSRNPRSRVSAINLHSPVPARLIAMWSGDGTEEYRYHEKFAAFRKHNEWFVIEGELADFCTEHRGRGVAAIVSWDEAGSVGRERQRASLRERMSAVSKARWADPVWRAERDRLAVARKAKKGQPAAKSFDGGRDVES